MVILNVHDCPPNEIAKLAVPVVVGVPDMVYTMFPFPFAKLPVCNVAVKPVTPVDVTVCPVCVPPFPPVYGTVLLTLAAATPWPNVPALVAVEQLSAVIVPTGKITVLVRVQVFPPMLSAKLAVPLVAAVPVMVYVKLPAPIAKLPAAKVAVNPVTPVEFTVCPLCVPPFPPVYGTLLLTLAAVSPRVSVPVLVALAQVNAVIVPIGATVIASVQVCPPILSAKLAVPPLAGVPVIV